MFYSGNRYGAGFFVENMENRTTLELMEKLFDAKLKPLAKDISDVKKTLNGDGGAGLVEEVRSMKQKLGYITLGLSFGFTLLFEVGKDFIKGRLKL